MKTFSVWMLLIAVMVLLAFASAFAQTQTVNQNCTFAWDAYPDQTIKEFKMYLNKDGVQLPAVTAIPKTATSLTCKAAGVTTNGLYKANLHAVDMQGGESDPSNGLTFQVIVKAAAPTGFKVQ